VSINTSGNPVDANTIPIPKKDADRAFDAATCIGCGACVATCKNSSAMLFVAAKVFSLKFYFCIVRVKLNFQDNGYGSNLIDQIFNGYSSKTFIHHQDLMTIRTQVWDYPVKVDFFQTSEGVFARLQADQISLSFTTQLIIENRPIGTLRFEGRLNSYKILSVNKVIREVYIPVIALITENGLYIAVDE
jgi:ferredoxin